MVFVKALPDMFFSLSEEVPYSQLIITLNYLILRVVFVFIRFFTIYEKSPFFELKTPHSYYPFIVILRQKQCSEGCEPTC